MTTDLRATREDSRVQSIPLYVEFADNVHYTLHGNHSITKGGPSFLTGLWLGRDPESVEHIVATKTTVVKARSIRNTLATNVWTSNSDKASFQYLGI